MFRLPDVGEGTAEAEIVAWHVAVGDRVAEDQNLVDVMTDKATVEMTSPVSGTVVSLHGSPGDRAPVGAPLVELDVEGAGNAEAGAAAIQAERKPVADGDRQVTLPRGAAPAGQAPSDRERLPRAHAAAAETTEMAAAGMRARPLASPAVRARAEELGIKLQFVAGSGPAGRIGHADIDRYLATGGAPAGPVRVARDGIEDVRVIGLRRKIAEKMQESKRHIPHFGYV